jgi:pentapeptide MXKDX repeat protein
LSVRVALGISVAALSLSLAQAPAAFGQDSMQIDLDFKSGRSSDDGVRKETISTPPTRKIYSRKKDGGSK